MHAVAFNALLTARRPIARSACRIIAGTRHSAPRVRTRHVRGFHYSPTRWNQVPPEDNGNGNVKDDVKVEGLEAEKEVKDAEKKIARSGRSTGARVRANRAKQQQQNGLPPVELPKGYWERCVLCAGEERRFGNLATIGGNGGKPRIINNVAREAAEARRLELVEELESLKGQLKGELVELENGGFVWGERPSEDPSSLKTESTIVNTSGENPSDTNKIAKPEERDVEEKGQESSLAEQVEDFELLNYGDLGYTIHQHVYNEIEYTLRAGLALRPPRQSNGQQISRPITLLQCPQDGAMNFLNSVVETVAESANADLIRLDAQDFAETLGPYVGENVAWQSPHLSALGYETARVAGKLEDYSTSKDSSPIQEEPESAEEEDDAIGISKGRIPPNFPPLDLKRMLKSITLGIQSRKTPSNLAEGGSPWMQVLDLRRDGPSKSVSSSSETDQWTNLKITTALERLIMGADEHRASRGETPDPNNPIPRDLIIQIQDYNEISATKLGAEMLSKLRPIVDKMWHAGRNIICVGTTANAQTVLALSKSEIQELQTDTEGETRTIYVPTDQDVINLEKFGSVEKSRIRAINVRQIEDMTMKMADGIKPDDFKIHIAADMELAESTIPSDWFLVDGIKPDGPEMETLKNHGLINEVKRDDVLGTLAAQIKTDGSSDEVLHGLNMLKELPKADYLASLEEAVWTHTRVRRLVTTIIGDNYPLKRIGGREFNKAMETLTSSDEVKVGYGQAAIKADEEDAKKQDEIHRGGSKKGQSDKIKELAKNCTPHEKKLFKGIVLSKDIKTTFGDIRAPSETIEALKTLTGLSLLRPEAFSYGVLATDKIPGLLLYGPPGTGKTLLAKAVAKESGATVLEISGADVNDMYVGEGEKNVKAVFSLAKKLSPCIVFIDEADAIFAARGSAGKQRSHRELINQFLREWDGMRDMSTFIMIATNRPFDLDDAVLRRLPRKLLVDLPLEKDREAILSIHLKDEIVDPSVSLPQLAKDTPFYSGSDLKNVAVAAALACIREENSAAAKHEGPEPYVYPAKRTLRKEHFVKALEEISASVSEDMSTLGQIRKFDERYGDRKGRRKKSAQLGFGGTRVVEKDSEAARVRKLEA